MTSNITILSTEYKVNKKKSIVTCIITGSLKLLDKYNNYMPDRWFKSITPDIKYGTFKCVGIAKCDEQDTFNLHIGKRIAESKAKINLYNKGRQMWNIYAKKQQEMLSKAMTCVFNNEVLNVLEKNHLHNLINEN